MDLKKEKYNVTVSYKWNENYTGNNTTQKLTIKKEVQETVSESSYASGEDYHYSAHYGTYIRQYTDSNGVQHIDGADSSSESYDPHTGLLTHNDGHGHTDQSYMR